jgi:hypothetical protein
MLVSWCEWPRTTGKANAVKTQKEVQAAHLQAAISQSASSSVFGGLNR